MQFRKWLRGDYSTAVASGMAQASSASASRGEKERIDQHDEVVPHSPSAAETMIDRIEAIALPDYVMNQVKSSIVWHCHLSKEEKFILLIDKYITENADMCVNLSFITRAEMMKYADYWLGNASSSAPAPARSFEIDHNVFDGVIIELYSLMKDSFSRFKCTDSFQVIVKKSDKLHFTSASTNLPSKLSASVPKMGWFKSRE